MGEWNDSYGSKATERKVYLGKGLKYFNKSKIGEFQLETHSLKKGDHILITGTTTGVIKTSVAEMRVNDKPVDEVKRGEAFSMPINQKIRASDKLYRIEKV